MVGLTGHPCRSRAGVTGCRGGTVAGVSAASTVVDRLYAAFNARDLDTWIGVLDDDVQIVVDAGRFRGREAARAYAEGITRAYSGRLRRRPAGGGRVG